MAKKFNNCGSEMKWNIKRFVFSRIILVKFKTFLEELVGWRRNFQPDGTMHNGITAWQHSIRIVACLELKTSLRFHPVSLSLSVTILCRACPYNRDHSLHIVIADMYCWDITCSRTFGRDITSAGVQKLQCCKSRENTFL